jgi:hypothetical protein
VEEEEEEEEEGGPVERRGAHCHAREEGGPLDTTSSLTSISSLFNRQQQPTQRHC